MKKLISILLSFIVVICMAGAFTGCGEEQPDEGTIQGEGNLYRLAYALDNGWIDAFDLKSIACGYYEWLKIEDNPYSGLWEEPADSLSEEVQAKIIEKYSFKGEGAKVIKYYGTYEGNVVVTLGIEGITQDESSGRDLELEGVIFPKLNLYSIRVFHYPEQNDLSVKVTGRMCDLEKAYKNGIIDENGLKSISCFYYDLYEYEENPYKGIYEPPTQKLSKETKNELKQAYLRQIIRETDVDFDGVRITKYYGIYNGSIVVTITGYGGCFFPDFSSVKEIGGVTFVKDCWMGIYVYKK